MDFSPVTRRVRVGLVGCGYISQVHLQAWGRIPEAEVVALCDTDPDKLRLRQDEFGIDAGFSSLATMLGSADLDALDICTGPQTHTALVEAGARAGKHLLVQKPLAPTVDEAVIMCVTAERAGVALMVKENFRWYPWFQGIRKALDDGLLGEVRRVQIRRELWGSPDPAWIVWAEQGYFKQMRQAIWYEVGVHIVDVLRFLLGEPLSVTAAMGRISPLMVGEDMVHAMFRFPGCFATCDLSWAHRGAPARTRVGQVRVDGTRGSIETEPDGALTFRDNYGGSRPLVVDLAEAEVRSHLSSQRNFVRALRGLEPLATPGRENVRALQAVFAAYRSAEGGTELTLT